MVPSMSTQSPSLMPFSGRLGADLHQRVGVAFAQPGDLAVLAVEEHGRTPSGHHHQGVFLEISGVFSSLCGSSPRKYGRGRDPISRSWCSTAPPCRWGCGSRVSCRGAVCPLVSPVGAAAAGMALRGQVPDLVDHLLEGVSGGLHAVGEHLPDASPGHRLGIEALRQGEVDLPVGFALGDIDDLVDDIERAADAVDGVLLGQAGGRKDDIGDQLRRRGHEQVDDHVEIELLAAS